MLMMSIKEIAAAIRKDLKEKFPQCKFSIQTKYFTGGAEVFVALMSAPFEAIIKKGYIKNGEFIETENKNYAQLNPYFLKPYNDAPEYYNNGAILSPEAWEATKTAADLFFKYNDYDHYYLHLSIGKWDKPFEKKA